MKTKTKLSVAALFLATTQLTNAMENQEQQNSPSGVNGQGNITRVLPDAIYVPLILECPLKCRIQRRGVDKFTRDAIDKANEEGKYLEELVYGLVRHNKLYVKVGEICETKSRNGRRHAVQTIKLIYKKPHNTNQLRDWCANGYQFKKHESPLIKKNKIPKNDYSLYLFHYGIRNNCLPIVRYTLPQLNKYWSMDQDKLRELLIFRIGNIHYTPMAYLAKMDFVDIANFALSNEYFFKFTFGDDWIEWSRQGLLPIKNINLSAVLMHGSKTMVIQFSQDKRLINMCLNVDKPNGEGKINPVELAKKLERPQEIIDIIENAIENIKKTTTETEL